MCMSLLLRSQTPLKFLALHEGVINRRIIPKGLNIDFGLAPIQEKKAAAIAT